MAGISMELMQDMGDFYAAANNTSTFPVDENGDPVFYLLENTVALPEAGILLVPISLETLLDEL